MKSIFAIIPFILLFGRVKGQNLIHIPNDATTLSEAVQLAQNGDTIYLSPGIYTDSVHVINKQLIFLGEPGGQSVLSPGENERAFVLLDANVQFMHLRFDDFDLQSPPPNFGISASYSDVSIDHCRFQGMFSPVSLLWGNLRMQNSIISNPRNGRCIAHNGGTFLLYNNLFYDLTITPISINRAHGEFFNNTVVGSTPDQYRGVINNSDSISHFFNNIITGFGIGIHLNASDSLELDALRIHHNNIHNVAAPYWYEYNEDLSLPIYSGELFPNPGTGEINVPPGFADVGNNDYSLQATSLCIDAGDDAFSFFVPNDLAGNDRLIGMNPDMGAYEYSSPLSVGENATVINTQIELYPNPVHDYVWIYFDEEFTGKVEIIDTSGKIRHIIPVANRLKIRLQLPFKKGLYLIQVSDHNFSATRKVVKL